MTNPQAEDKLGPYTKVTTNEVPEESMAINSWTLKSRLSRLSFISVQIICTWVWPSVKYFWTSTLACTYTCKPIYNVK